MASKFPKENQVRFKPRKGHDMAWSCDKHGEPVSFRCKKHKLCICHKCSTKDHRKPCELEDIEDVIFEMKGRVEDFLLQAEEAQGRLRRVDSEIISCGSLARDHIKNVSDMVHDAFEKRIQKAKDRELEDIRVINEEADEEIRIINEKRDKRIQECKARMDAIAEEKAGIITETRAIDAVVAKRLGELQRENKHRIDTMGIMVNNVNRIKQADKTLVKEAAQVAAAEEERFNEKVLQDVTECLDRIKSEVRRVKFIEGEIGGEHHARIDGYVGKWKLVKSIDIPAIVDRPSICGVVSKDEVCVRNIQNSHIYVTNIRTSLTEKVIDNRDIDRMEQVWFTQCASIDTNAIVCITETYKTETGPLNFVTQYDGQWKMVQNITLEQKTTKSCNFICADVDRDGMILISGHSQRNIFVISPTDGQIVNTITIPEYMLVRGALQALSSGDILLKTDSHAFTIISRSGEIKATIANIEWGLTRCHVDKLTDTIYIRYWDAEREHEAVDQASPDGKIQARRIIMECNRSLECCHATPSGYLVSCPKDKLSVYKKTFTI